MKIETHVYRYCEISQFEEDIPVIVEFEYQPAEKQELNYPGCDESCEVTAVKTLDGSDFEINMYEESELEITGLIAYSADKQQITER